MFQPHNVLLILWLSDNNSKQPSLAGGKEEENICESTKRYLAFNTVTQPLVLFLISFEDVVSSASDSKLDEVLTLEKNFFGYNHQLVISNSSEGLPMIQ